MHFKRDNSFDFKRYGPLIIHDPVIQSSTKKLPHPWSTTINDNNFVKAAGASNPASLLRSSEV